jgi:preprotein translocase subunit SecG
MSLTSSGEFARFKHLNEGKEVKLMKKMIAILTAVAFALSLGVAFAQEAKAPAEPAKKEAPAKKKAAKKAKKHKKAAKEATPAPAPAPEAK